MPASSCRRAPRETPGRAPPPRTPGFDLAEMVEPRRPCLVEPGMRPVLRRPVAAERDRRCRPRGTADRRAERPRRAARHSRRRGAGRAARTARLDAPHSPSAAPRRQREEAEHGDRGLPPSRTSDPHRPRRGQAPAADAAERRGDLGRRLRRYVRRREQRPRKPGRRVERERPDGARSGIDIGRRIERAASRRARRPASTTPGRWRAVLRGAPDDAALARCPSTSAGPETSRQRPRPVAAIRRSSATTSPGSRRQPRRVVIGGGDASPSRSIARASRRSIGRRNFGGVAELAKRERS